MTGRGKQTAEIAELLDLIEKLRDFSRWGTFDADPGEGEAWRWAERVLARYGRAASTPETRGGKPC